MRRGPSTGMILCSILFLFLAEIPRQVFGHTAFEFASAKIGESSSRVLLTFSKPVASSTVNTNAFSLPPASVTGAFVDPIFRTHVILETSPLDPLLTYTVSVTNLQDESQMTMLNASLPLSRTPNHLWDRDAVITGYQDEFGALSTNWVVRGDTNANAYVATNGFLHVTARIGDPNHLIYVADYDRSNHEVLARIRVGTGPMRRDYGSRAGIAVGVHETNNQGINYLFVNPQSALQSVVLPGLSSFRAIGFLNDLVTWGPSRRTAWATNEWYWMRLVHRPNGVSNQPDVFAKTWPADGVAPEPARWETWDYQIDAFEGNVRSGYVGITASSVFTGRPNGGIYVDVNGMLPFDIDYILIKAAGLPKTIVAPAFLGRRPRAEQLQIQNGMLSFSVERRHDTVIEIETSSDLRSWTHLLSSPGSAEPLEVKVPVGLGPVFVRLIERPTSE